MISFKLGMQAASLSALVFALAACDSNQTPALSGESPEIDPGVVYSEAFADSGIFTITKNSLGGYNYSVEARIGSEAEARLVAGANKPTLAEVYQSIHEGKTETPAVVSEVSHWLESQAPSGSEKRNESLAPPALEKAASQSDFTNGYCKSFIDGSYYWKSMSCIWKPGNNQTTSGGVNGDNVANDRVYAWNNTAYPAKLRLWNTNFTGYANPWNPTLNPYWVTWFSWGGTYSNANAVISLPGGIFGEIALSNHARYPR